MEGKSLFDPYSSVENFETLYRAVRPWKRFWKKNGKISPAAFKDESGLSIDRDGDRKEQKVIDDFRKRKFEGTLVSVGADKCKEIDIYLKPMPQYWPYHVLALNSSTELVLSDEKCDKLRFLIKTVTEL